jgi:hypothetical protein
VLAAVLKLNVLGGIGSRGTLYSDSHSSGTCCLSWGDSSSLCPGGRGRLVKIPKSKVGNGRSGDGMANLIVGGGNLKEPFGLESRMLGTLAPMTGLPFALESLLVGGLDPSMDSVNLEVLLDIELDDPVLEVVPDRSLVALIGVETSSVSKRDSVFVSNDMSCWFAHSVSVVFALAGARTGESLLKKRGADS